MPTEAERARAEGRSYERASVVITRILAERRRRWEEAELAKVTAKGRAPRDGKWKAKYREPVAPDTSGLPQLPEGWCWAAVDQLAYDVRYGSSARTDGELSSGVPVLRMGNIIDGAISFADLKYLPRDHPEFPELLLERGDMRFNRTNSAELVGKTAVFRGDSGPCSLSSYLMRVRLVSQVEPDLSPSTLTPFGGVAIDREIVAEEHRRFVADILRRASAMSDDERVRSLRQDLNAITSADPDEQAWCRIVGRMGFDFYDTGDLPSGIMEFLDDIRFAEERPSLRELTAVARPELISKQWRWVEAVSRSNGIGAGRPSTGPFEAAAAQNSAAQYGCRTARKIRELGNIDSDAPIDSVESVVTQASGADVKLETRNHFTGGGVRVMSGWHGDDIVLAGPSLNTRPHGKRFAVGRGVYHALTAAAMGERLVTDAFDWDQRASRAFAAELLAPQAALRAEGGEMAGPATVALLAQRFQASEMMIVRQLQNAGVTVIQEE